MSAKVVAAQSVRLDFLTAAYSAKSNHKLVSERALSRVVNGDHTDARSLQSFDDGNIVGKTTGTFHTVTICREAKPGTAIFDPVGAGRQRLRSRKCPKKRGSGPAKTAPNTSHT